jgi:hypothetical protein
MENSRRQELTTVIDTLEARYKHYDQVYGRKDTDEMARSFMSLFNDFDYALQFLCALRDDRQFDPDAGAEDN